MEIEVGVGLIRLADPNRGGDLLERIQRVRQNVAAEIGIIMPKVRIRDNMRLEPNEYRIKIADMPVAQARRADASCWRSTPASPPARSTASRPRTRLRHRCQVDQSRPRGRGRDARLHGRRSRAP